MTSTSSSPDSYTFTRSTLSDREIRKQIQGILRAHNEQSSTIRGPEVEPLNIYVTDAQGQLLGGIMALTYWGWLVIDMLALVEPMHGQGVGTELMQRVEDEARQRGCTRAHTTTYEHQALGFYERMGYRVVGRLDNYPEGYAYYWLRKDL